MGKNSAQHSSSLWKLALLCGAAVAIPAIYIMTSAKETPPKGYHRAEVSQEAALAAAAAGNNSPNEVEKDQTIPATAQSQTASVAR